MRRHGSTSKDPTMPWIVHRREYEPAAETLNVWVRVQGPVQVSPWGKPGRLKVRLWSVPASWFCNVAVTAAPDGTCTSVLSNFVSLAVKVRLTAEARGADVGAAVAAPPPAEVAGGFVAATE